jgi:pSer/pThr/pTyr-binding forkhead associated (FHA) protein
VATPAAALPPTPPNAPVVSDTGVPGTMVEGHALRFSVPAEGTMQFLPGRLEIGSGLDAGREIRFVHVPGPNGTEITFGRTEGALYRHVQLHEKTVSRQHAVLRWRAGRWFLQNLSQTNPVARNGVTLAPNDAPRLRDGDRIEMGEVMFTFRSR